MGYQAQRKTLIYLFRTLHYARSPKEALPRQLRDKEYVVSVTAESIGEDSTCAVLADEVQRLHTIVSVLEEKGRK
jgi:hypothetical protein